MRTIRDNTFETNSSSTHSITVSNAHDWNYNLPITVTPEWYGEFGWEWETWSSIEERIAYMIRCLVSYDYTKKTLQDKVKPIQERLRNLGIYFDLPTYEEWEDGYVDHADWYQTEMEEIYNDDSHERPFTNKIYGSDISPKAIDIASRNIKSASVGKYIELKAQPLQNIEEVAHEGGILVTNPPYGERIAVEDMEGLYRTLGEKLKRVFKGYKAWVIGYNTELLDSIGLKPSLKFPLYNGALECELREYVIFEGTYAEFRKEGRSVKNEEFKGERKPEYRRREFEPTFKDDKNGEKSRVNKWRREDGDGNRKEGERRERKSRFHTEGKPKNALEEKLRKPYHERRREEESRRNKRMGDEERQSRRSETGDNNAGQQREQEHNEARTSRIVKFRQPQLSADKEQPIIHGRRNSWRRTDLPEENKGNENE